MEHAIKLDKAPKQLKLYLVQTAFTFWHPQSEYLKVISKLYFENKCETIKEQYKQTRWEQNYRNISNHMNKETKQGKQYRRYMRGNNEPMYFIFVRKSKLEFKFRMRQQRTIPEQIDLQLDEIKDWEPPGIDQHVIWEDDMNDD